MLDTRHLKVILHLSSVAGGGQMSAENIQGLYRRKRMFGYWWKVSSVFPYVLLLNSILVTNTDVLKRTSGERRLRQNSPGLLHGNIKSHETGSNVQIKDMIRRHKRALLFPNDIKLCPEETVSHAIDSYLKYYKLRGCGREKRQKVDVASLVVEPGMPVCQEAIWEAFKIFWDRLPERHEHQTWIDACNQGLLNIFDIGMSFSKTEEHQHLIMEKVSLQMENVSSLESITTTNATSSENNFTLEELCNNTHGLMTSKALNIEKYFILAAERISIDGINISVEGNENTTPGETEQVTKKSSNQIVEFFIQLAGENYTGEELSDPAMWDYQKLTDHVHAKMENIFGKFPGYQTINILEFRFGNNCKTVNYYNFNILHFNTLKSNINVFNFYFRKSQNPDSSSNVTVHCTVTFDVNTGVIPNETLQFINLNSENMEDDLPLETENQPTAAYTITDFRNYIVEALHKENLIGNGSPTFNPETLHFINEHSMNEALNSIKIELEDQTIELSNKEDEDGQYLESNEASGQFHSTIIDLPSVQTIEERWRNAEASPVTLTSLEPQSISEETMPLPSSREFPVFAPSGTDVTTTINVGEKTEETSDPLTSQILVSDGIIKQPIFDKGTIFYSESGSGIEEEYLWSWSTIASQTVSSNKPQSGTQDSTSNQSRGVKIQDDLSMDYDANQSDVNIKGLITNPTAVGMATIISNEADALWSTEAASGFGAGIISHVAEAITKEAPVEWMPENVLELTMQTSEAAENDLVAVLPVTELSTKGQAITETFVVQPSGAQTSAKGNQATDSFILEQFAAGSYAKGHMLTELATIQQEILASAATGHTMINSLPAEDEAAETTTTGPIKQFLTTVSNLEQLTTEQLSTSSGLSASPWAPTELGIDSSSMAQSILDSSNMIQKHTELPNDVQLFSKIPAAVDTVLSNINDTGLNNPVFQNTDSSTVVERGTRSTTGVPYSEYIANTSLAYSGPDNGANSANETIWVLNPRATSAAVQPTAIPSVTWDVVGGYVTLEPRDATVIEHNEVKSSQSASQDNEEWSEVQDISVELDHSDIIYPHEESNNDEEMATGYREYGATAPTDQPGSSDSHTSSQALIVFFSLRVTNMIFSDDLFNKSSHEYITLEQRFLELLVPYLQSNLSDFKHLEILNFRNGSIIVNSRMKFAKPVPQDVTNAVYLILDDFCNTAYQRMNLAIDRFSLDVESGNGADPCKFQACNEYSECLVNHQSGEAECVCDTGYLSVDGLPCQSICDIDTDFCLNDGKCDTIPGQGAICRCRVGENWWYRGEHCEEYVSETLVVGIAITSVAGFLLVASVVIFFIANMLRAQYAKSETHASREDDDSLASAENGTKYNPMYESDATTAYSHYKRRYPHLSPNSSSSGETSANFSSDEIRHVYECTELSKEEIQDRLRIIDLYTKDKQFAEFVRQHQTAMANNPKNPPS
ncbi:interphotoreceptor matrix proteoglycan 2 [Amblyraja radiata]|uniref:interphotoreceptor matrix proteoglycan 2 n=1 Tax=Amblyraja radiata TaxID=386614 RepID=UPI00140209BB|nr:interphotoreceptor matrix proteoglycan 2 [Amblyraja radiata]